MKRCPVVFAEKEKGVLSVPRPEFLSDSLEEAPLRWERLSWVLCPRPLVQVELGQSGLQCRVGGRRLSCNR